MSFASGGSAHTSFASTAAQLERLTCLIVDGNRHMRTLLKGVIRAFGIRDIRESSDGVEAINEMKSVPVDLVITEFALETLDGMDLVKLLRTANDSPNTFVPIIMLTGHTERHIVARARDVGVNEFLAKPISAEALYVRIVSSVFNPRQFVKAKGFMGPDRRRHTITKFKGTDRRKTPPEIIIPPAWTSEPVEENVLNDYPGS